MRGPLSGRTRSPPLLSNAVRAQPPNRPQLLEQHRTLAPQRQARRREVRRNDQAQVTPEGTTNDQAQVAPEGRQQRGAVRRLARP
jgi:hypothetical protein